MTWVEQALEDSTIVRRFRELPTRQRQASMMGGILVAIVVVYIGIWEPVFDYRENAIDRMTTARQNLEWMQQNETAARGRLNSGAENEEVSIAKLSTSARQFGFSLQRIQSMPSGGVSIQLQRQPFNPVLRWLEFLNGEYGYRVVNASLNSYAEGLVDARITIQ
mgnify:FL=1